MPDANKAQPGAPATEHCWGAQLQCAHEGTCAHRFRPGKRHFKTKFCAECTALLVVPTARVRALSDAGLRRQFVNMRAEGAWTRISRSHASSGGCTRYRVVNNTKGCAPPALVVFDGEPPPLAWPPLPDAWLTEGGDGVALCVGRGTLVPAGVPGVPVQRARGAARDGPLLSVTMRLQMPALKDEAEAAEAERAASPPPPPPEPSACDHPALAPLGDIGAFDADDNDHNDDNDDNDHNDDAFATLEHAKKMVRMLRNRASAATSRERKRKYIAHLEDQVDELTRVVQTLRSENAFWKDLGLQPGEGVPFLDTSPRSEAAACGVGEAFQAWVV